VAEVNIRMRRHSQVIHFKANGALLCSPIMVHLLAHDKIGPIIESMHAPCMEARLGIVPTGNTVGAPAGVTHISALVGRVKQKLAPRGELLAAHKRPPCDSTMERLIRRPMPVP
jgi:hypothetical protein